MQSLDLSSKYENMGEEEEIDVVEKESSENEPESTEEDSSTNVSEEIFEEEEDTIPAQEIDIPDDPDIEYPEFPIYKSSLGINKPITRAKIALVKSGHYDKVTVAFVGREWQVIWGADIVRIADKLGKPYLFEKIGRMKKEVADELFFQRMLADGGLNKTQCNLLAAKYIAQEDTDPVVLQELYSDQLTIRYIEYASMILKYDEERFEEMLKTGKARLSTGSTTSLKTVAAFVAKMYERKRKQKEQLEAAAMDFISLQASQGIAKEDLAKVFGDMASSLSK